jgi:hypothetical protein
MSLDFSHSLVVVPICRDTYMLLPSKMEGGGDQPARTLSVYLVWGTGVALGCDESGRFEPCIEDNVDSRGRTRRGIKSPTKSYVWDRFLVGWIVAFAVAVCQLSAEVIVVVLYAGLRGWLRYVLLRAIVPGP